jgi:hypothetical protein
MIALRLIHLIEKHSDDLADGLTRKVLSSERTRGLRRVPAPELHQRCREIYRNLSDWLVTKTEGEIERVYGHLGARRYEQGTGLADLCWAILLTKEHLWEFLEREGISTSTHEILGELELLRSLDQFFDRAVYYATLGYEQARTTQAA